MGRDPVELAKRAKYQPPAMRVRVKKLYKITFPIYNRGVQAAIKERKGDLYGEESQ